ncbi:MAG: peptide-methionine (R)-S-oxide reductase, partial [Lentisphaeria bacterium]|nr:peptide-methionine (R)-S-oxide reductase [Lentisphaeria bacterium]
MDKQDKHELQELSSPYGALSDIEREVILNKGTERPFTGKYYQSSEQGVYACRNC